MKKLLYLIMAAATLLFAAGCQQETGLSGDDGSLADVTFRVALDGMQTKAFSDGTKADSLVVMVYKDNNGFEYLPNVEPQEKPEFDANLTAEVNLKLVRGETYRIVFWAMHNDPSLYIFDKENAAVTVNIDGLYSNDDNRDAFYGVWEGAIGRDGVEDGDVNLYRPFAQLNVLTSEADWEAAINNGVLFAGSAMTVKAPTKLNFFDGSVDEPAVYEFAQADIDQDVNIPGYEDYKYIAMNYILTDEGSNVGETNDPLKIEVYRESGLLADFDLVNVPVRRNYRTILVGDIFCADAIFQVTIQNEFGGNETVPMDNAEDQTITFNPDSAPGQDPGFEYDEDALTGAYTMTVGETLDFAGAFSSNSTFDPIYTSSDEEVGKFAAEVGDAPTLFTALAAGQTVVNLHFNAVINGEEVKSEIKNFKSADVNITITVVDEAEGYTVTIDQDIIDQEEEVGGVWIVDGDDEYESQFQAGATVNLIYYPIGDYDLTALWYLDENEEPVDIDFADGEASFIMPEYDVIIFATFEEAGDEPLDAVFELYEGDIVEGYYVIVYNTTEFAMNNTVDKNRLQYEAVVIENDAIVNPDASIVWYIAPNGDYWTIYSDDAQKYAASTGTKNQAAVIADGTDAKAQWTITAQNSDPVTYEIENVSNKTAGVNFTLRNNDTYGFACYATGTGGPLSLYKFVGGDEPQEYYISLNQTNYGSLECDQDNNYAPAGETVTVTLTPSENCHYVENTASVTTETSPNGIEFDIVESPTAEGVFIVTFTMPAEDVTVSADFEEDGEPSGPFAISIDDVQNGSIVSDPASEAEEGATVTLTITPDDGYAYVEQSLQVIAVNQSVVDVEVNASLAAQGVYEASFTMPACDVLVTAAFEEQDEPNAIVVYLDSSLGLANGSAFSSTYDESQMVSVVGDQGTNTQNGPKYYTTGNAVRFYAGNTITVSSNSTMTRIELVSGEGDTTTKEISASTGDYEAGVWTGSANEVVFTVAGGNGNRRIAQILVTLDEQGGGDVPVTAGIEIDGDFDDWEVIDEFSGQRPGGADNSRIYSWKMTYDDDYVYFYLKLNTEKMKASRYLYVGFDTDSDEGTGTLLGGIPGMEKYAYCYPVSSDEPFTLVQGVDEKSSINSESNTNFEVWSVTDTEDPSVTHVELSVPRETLGVEAGTISVAVAYNDYNTAKQSITLE